MKAPYSQGTTQLTSPCLACGYTTGLRIIRHEHDLGFIRCGRCDSPLYSVREVSDRQAGEVAA
ncbi:hypothetical protein LC608_34715 [Nostoc sp. XA010]|uniref:hypothetical protein n=1 Tax=Nostoc sp. XA010 TaxID=2780407 RepID=UPI001E28CB55|nr:hypothetical protein [Nostoc sp. XA010]MCC5661999.1 hypothetical protein [Nostoc sp. XA010]